jgi:hypothetical protein
MLKIRPPPVHVGCNLIEGERLFCFAAKANKSLVPLNTRTEISRFVRILYLIKITFEHDPPVKQLDSLITDLL